jgi:hypothetical protein
LTVWAPAAASLALLEAFLQTRGVLPHQQVPGTDGRTVEHMAREDRLTALHLDLDAVTLQRADHLGFPWAGTSGQQQ